MTKEPMYKAGDIFGWSVYSPFWGHRFKLKRGNIFYPDWKYLITWRIKKLK